MKPKAGDIVLVPFPFTDQTGSKVRPAIVISIKPYDDDVVIVFVTSKIKKRGGHILTIIASECNGLRQNSTVVCSKLASIKTSLLIGGIGKLESKDYQKIKQAMAAVLGL
jgi:mRNA interferase MazF